MVANDTARVDNQNTREDAPMVLLMKRVADT